jgi:cysteine desulfuration protein SufE
MSIDPELAEKLENLPDSLRGIVDEFRAVTPRERLELLLEFAMSLPDLPQRLESDRDAMEQVHECQSPVFLFTELDAAGSDHPQVHFHLDIPPEAPTVRGYAAILAEGLDGVEPQVVLNTPEDVYMLLGLHEAITPQRLRGLHALMVTMKRQVAKLL